MNDREYLDAYLALLKRRFRQNRTAWTLIALGQVAYVGVLLTRWWLFEITEIPLFVTGFALLIDDHIRRRKS